MHPKTVRLSEKFDTIILEVKQLYDKLQKAEADLAETRKEYHATRDEVDRWKRMFQREYESRKIETAELAELQEAVAWYFECEKWLWDSIEREGIDCTGGKYCPWCASQDEIDESFKQSRAELKRMAGGE